MGIKDFMLKQMLKSKLKGVPPEQQEMIMAAVEENPEFFKKIGDEIKEMQKQGKGEMEATMSVMRRHQAELQRLMQNSKS